MGKLLTVGSKQHAQSNMNDKRRHRVSVAKLTSRHEQVSVTMLTHAMQMLAVRLDSTRSLAHSKFNDTARKLKLGLTDPLNHGLVLLPGHASEVA